MTQINNGKKRPRIHNKETIAPEILNEETVVQEVEIIAEEPVLDVVCEETPVEEIEVVEEISAEEPAVEETTEEVEEVPLEMSEEEMQIALDEEGSLDGTAEEVEELASAEIVEEDAPVEEPAPIAEEVAVEETVEAVEEVAPVEEPAPIVEEVAVEETEETVEEVAPVEEPAPIVEEVAVEKTVEAIEEVAPVEEPAPVVEETQVEEVAVEELVPEETEDETEDAEEEKVEEAPKKDEFKLTAPQNLADILANICTKRARKLIYRPADVIFSHTTTVLGTDKANDEKIKVKSILDAEIKQGVKLGYLDKFDGLKMSELKEEYENDIVYEYADQEFKRTGILLDGDKVKVYVYDWDLKACHHVGYIDDESAELVKPYIIDREKYSFDINGIIVGGKYKKIIKDEKSGKITVEKGNDGNLGLEIDINIINRKD